MSILKRLSFRRKYHQVFPLSVANIWTFDPNSVFWTLNVFFPIVDERIVVLSVWLKTFPASPLISAEGGEGLDFSNISDQSRSPLFSIPNTRGIFVFCTFWIWCFANSWQIVGKCEEAISGSQGWKMYFGQQQQQQQQSRLTGKTQKFSNNFHLQHKMYLAILRKEIHWKLIIDWIGVCLDYED